MNVSKELNELLRTQKITSSELARRLVVSRQFTGQLLSGKRGATEELLRRIAAATGTEVTVTIEFKELPVNVPK